MKAFVIKNKEGKYFCGFDGFIGMNIFSDRIIDGLNTQTPTLKHCREEIKDFNLKDCEPVKITIAEGDLEQQLAEKDKEIKKHIDALEYWENNIPNQRQAIRKQVCDEIRQEFEKRLKGKKWEDSIIIGKVCNTINDVLDQIEQAKESIK